MIFAANWKMNLDNASAYELIQNYISELAVEPYANHEVIVLASTVALAKVVDLIAGTKLQLYAQDVSKYSGFGSFTGETSAEQLKSIGVKGVLLGHMERRTLLEEKDVDINLKIKNALNAGLKVILSVGESVKDLDEDQQLKLIQSQLEVDLDGVSSEKIQSNLVIAYETVNTISSFGNLQAGNRLPVEDISKKASFIKQWLIEKFGSINIPIIYGGSVSAENINQFSASSNLCNAGFLVGKKSLDINEFKALIAAV